MSRLEKNLNLVDQERAEPVKSLSSRWSNTAILDQGTEFSRTSETSGLVLDECYMATLESAYQKASIPEQSGLHWCIQKNFYTASLDLL